MADRLSDESLLSALDAGHTHIAWLSHEQGGILGGYDLQKICADPAAAEIIPSIPAQTLYMSLMRQGLADNLAVLPHLSADQVIRFFDYDVWCDDKPTLRQAVRWLTLFREVDSAELLKRYRGLDEEYQIALLSGKVKTYTDEDLDHLDDALKDELHAMPCNTVFYQILTEDQREYECIQALIDAALEGDIGYAYMLLAYSEAAVPNETEDQLAQFRRARLEEDGFVTYDEGLALFHAVDLAFYIDKYSIVRAKSLEGRLHETALAAGGDPLADAPFLTRLLDQAGKAGWSVDERYQVHQSLLYVVNGLCAAAKVEPDDLAGINRLMQQAQALVSLGIEFLSGGDMDLGLLLLQKEAAKNLFRVGLGLIDFTRNRMLERFVEARLPGAEHLKRLLALRKWGLILQYLDRSVRDLLGFELTAILRGLFNRFPVMPLMDGADAGKPDGGISFVVIDSLRSFSQFLALLDGISGLIHVARSHQVASLTEPLEKIVATQFLLFALEKSPGARVVEPAEIKLFAQIPEADLKAFAEEYWLLMHERLTPSFHEWSVSGGYANPGASIGRVIALAEDIVQGLLRSRHRETLLKSLVLSVE